MKVVIFCGGMGTRLKEETEYKPKPLVEIGGHPILWHIMKMYAHYGFKDFVLCLGYKGDMIKEYFFNYARHNYDCTLELASGKVKIHSGTALPDWTITCVDTGQRMMTGARLKKIEQFIDEEFFMLTYGDGLADINLKNLLDFHCSNKRIGTVTGVRPPSRFGELRILGQKVEEFSEKSQIKEGFINGGFFVFDKRIFSYLNDQDDCIFEREPLEKLSSDQQLAVYKHDGFWQCMDTYRDWQLLNNLWEGREVEKELHFKSVQGGGVPWKVWHD